MKSLIKATRGPVETVEGKGVKIPIYSGKHHGRQSYLIAYYAEGRRVRERAGSLEDARQQARAKIAELTTGAVHVGALTPRQTAVVTDAIDVLRPTGVSLSRAAREYVEAVEILGGKGTLADAARLFVRHHERATLPAITFSAAAAKFLSRNESLGLSDEYKATCRKHLAILAKALGTAKLGDLRQPEIAAALATATGKNSARRYNNLRGTVNALFGFSQKEGWLPLDKVHEASLVERRNDRNGGTIAIYTPEEMAVIMQKLPADMKPWAALGGLAGLRTSEVHRVTWEMIRLSAGVIVLDKSFTKTKRRRVIPICPALARWLKPVVGTGRLFDCSLTNFEYRTKKAWEALNGKDGKPVVPKRKNAFRHSYGSYRFALLKNENEVSAEMGNSPDELRESYAEIALPADAKKWFLIGPTGARK